VKRSCHQIEDGCVISWDGTNICHCTSMRISTNNPSERHPPGRYAEWVHKSDIFGFHFVNLAGNLKHMKESRKKEYCLIMGDAMGEFNWKAFAKVKYPEEEYYW